MKPIHELDPDTAAAIAGIDFTRGRTTTNNGGELKVLTEEALVKVKLANKTEALVALARAH